MEAVKVLIFLILLLFLDGGDCNKFTMRLGGTNVNLGEVPHQVFFTVLNWRLQRRYCGGSITSPKTILTAGQCCKNGIRDVFVGMVDRRKLKTAYRIKKIIIHPGYKRARGLYFHDLCILVTRDEIKFNSDVKKIELADNRPVYGTMLQISGWGLMQMSDAKYQTRPNILRKLEVPLLHPNGCLEVYSTDFYLADDDLCAGYIDRATGEPSDCGGPLTLGNKLVGVVSRGRGLLPTLYTDVTVHKNWILQEIRNNEN